MGKGKAIIIVSCIVTFILFGTMCVLMRTVNPPPLPVAQEESKDDPLIFMSDELISETFVPQRTNNNTESSRLRTSPRSQFRISQNSLRQHAAGLRKDFVTENYTSFLKHSIQKVVPPIWPPIRKTVKTQENRALDETGKVANKSTVIDFSSVIKRSVNDVKQIGRDLNSIILKIIDDSGQFNVEIKIGLNDGFVKKNNETKQSKIQSKDKSKYSILLKTKDKTNITKNTIISVMPNDFVAGDEYDNHLEAQNKLKKNMIQASIVDFNNSTKYNITENKATVIPIYRDIFKPILIFYNQTKSIYNSDTKSKINEKRDLLEKSNDANDEYKTNHNSFETANTTVFNSTIQSEKSTNTAYNITIQLEKGGNKNKKEDLLEKPNDASEGCETNVNSSKSANDTAYNLTIQIENGGKKNKKEDLLEKPNDASEGCETNSNSTKAANGTAYNFTIQIEKEGTTNKEEDLSEKPNDVSDGCQTNVNSPKTANITANNLTVQSKKENNTAYNLTTQAEKANNTHYNLTIQIEKGYKQNEKRDFLEKPNDVNDGYRKNLNITNTANNLTAHIAKQDKKSEKGDLLAKPNDASDGYKTNLNSYKARNNTAFNLTIQTENANNTAYNITIMTEKTKLQYYVVTTRNENTTVDVENFTISTKSLEETPTMAEEVNSTIPLANGDSVQNDTHDIIEMKKLVQSQNKTTI